MTPAMIEANLLKYGMALPPDPYGTGVPMGSMSDDPRVQMPLDAYPSEALGSELRRLKGGGMFEGTSVADDALNSLARLEEGYDRIKGVVAGMKEPAPTAEPKIDSTPMPKLVRYEEPMRPEADPSTLDERAEAAKERLIANSSSGLARSASGGVIGDRSRGTPIDESKAGPARAKRAARQEELMANVRRNHMLEQGWRQMPQGGSIDPLLMLMGKDAIPLLAAREQSAAMDKRAQQEAALAREKIAAEERMSSRDPGGLHAAQAEKARAESKLMGDPAMQQRSIVNAMPDGPEKQLALSDMLRKAQEQARQQAGLPADLMGMPAAPPVSDVNATIDTLFREAEIAGIDTSTPQFLEAAKRKGISAEMLQQWAAENRNRYNVRSHLNYAMAGLTPINWASEGLGLLGVPTIREGADWLYRQFDPSGTQRHETRRKRVQKIDKATSVGGRAPAGKP